MFGEDYCRGRAGRWITRLCINALRVDAGEGRAFVFEDTSKLFQAHDLEGLLDRRRGAAKIQRSAFLRGIVNNFDYDRDSYAVDHFRFGKVEH